MCSKKAGLSARGRWWKGIGSAGRQGLISNDGRWSVAVLVAAGNGWGPNWSSWPDWNEWTVSNTEPWTGMGSAYEFTAMKAGQAPWCTNTVNQALRPIQSYCELTMRFTVDSLQFLIRYLWINSPNFFWEKTDIGKGHTKVLLHNYMEFCDWSVRAIQRNSPFVPDRH